MQAQDVLLSEKQKRWIAVYPVYINSKKTVAEGRRISKERAVENPQLNELGDICKHLNFEYVVEVRLWQCYAFSVYIASSWWKLLSSARGSISKRLDAKRKITCKNQRKWKAPKPRNTKQYVSFTLSYLVYSNNCSYFLLLCLALVRKEIDT